MSQRIYIVENAGTNNSLGSYTTDAVPRVGEDIVINERNGDDGVVRDYRVKRISHLLAGEYDSDKLSLLRLTIFVTPIL